jgi:hypothetical protein
MARLVFGSSLKLTARPPPSCDNLEQQMGTFNESPNLPVCEKQTEKTFSAFHVAVTVFVLQFLDKFFWDQAGVKRSQSARMWWTGHQQQHHHHYTVHVPPAAAVGRVGFKTSKSRHRLRQSSKMSGGNPYNFF